MWEKLREILCDFFSGCIMYDSMSEQQSYKKQIASEVHLLLFFMLWNLWVLHLLIKTKKYKLPQSGRGLNACL